MTTRAGLAIIAVLLISIVGAAMLTGCTSSFDGICVVRPLGQDEHGNVAFRTYCEAVE